jgi:O-succinylbenzoic acid-coA ligase
MVLVQFLELWNNDKSPRMLVHTSGSTGKPKPLWVEKHRMEASARATCQYLGLKAGDTALLCMSLDYIAGKMMVVRSLVANLKLIVVEPNGHPLKDLETDIDFAAMVPLQVYNSLQVPAERERLMRIKHLIIGGSAIDEAMERELKAFPNAVWSTYGMTETLSHIALRRLNGQAASEWYTPLPGVEVSLNDKDCLVINAPHVCEERLETNDIATIKHLEKNCKEDALQCSDGQKVVFRILGRLDNVLVSGGIKIQIEEVERALHPHLSMPYRIVKCQDEKFGEVVGLQFVPVSTKNVEEETAVVKQICQKALPKYWQPKAYFPVKEIERTATGKIKRG